MNGPEFESQCASTAVEFATRESYLMSLNSFPGSGHPPTPLRRATWLTSLVLAAALVSCTSSEFEHPDRLGPPGLVVADGQPHLWLLVKQEESRLTTLSRGYKVYGELHNVTYYHLILTVHDTRSAARQWTRNLLELKGDQGGHSAQGRILGQDGDIVWLFLADRIVGLSSRDGAERVDGAEIERRNPSLRNLLPRESKFYAFDGALVITAADARRYRVSPVDFAAEPYTPESEEAFARARAYSTEWNGAFATSDFLTRLVPGSTRWLGLFTEKEAADASSDEFGRKFSDHSRIHDARSGARRVFWTTAIGRTREFPEGAHDRFLTFTPVPGGPEYLEGGLMVKAGTREPLRPEESADVLVVHRTRIDADGRLALARLEDSLKPRWSTTLPIQQLGNRFEFPDRLLLCGECRTTVDGVTESHDILMSVQLSDGSLRAWNVTLEHEVGETGSVSPAHR